MTRQTRLRSAAKWAGITGAILVVLAAIVAVGAPVVFRGARFGRLVERMLPEMRGQVHVGGGSWSWGALLALVRERPAALTLEDVRINDPEGTEVLRIGRLSAQVEVRRAPVRAVFRELRIEDAEWKYQQMKGERRIGFLAALTPTGRPARARAKVGGSAELSIEDARLDGVTVTLDFPTWGLVLRDAHGTAGLAARAGGGAAPAFTFDVRGAEARGGGRLRILQGRGAFALPFSHGRLDRVATTADALDAIRLEASEVATGRSMLTIAGVFNGVYGISAASKTPGLTLEAKVADAADAAQEVARSAGLGRMPSLGPGARIGLRLDGPFALLHLQTTLDSPVLGRVAADATLSARRVAGGLDFNRFALGALLPLPLAPFASGSLDGRFRGSVEFGGPVSLDELSLLLTRPPGVGGPRTVRARIGGRRAPGPAGSAGWGLDLSGVRYAAGTIELPRLTFPLLGGRIAASGRIAIREPRETGWLAAPTVDLALRGDRLSIEKLIGISFVEGVTTFRAHVQGPLRDLTAEVDLPGRQALVVLGERMGLPPRVVLRLADDAVSFEAIRLTGPEGSAFEAAGQVAATGRLDLGVAVRDFPIVRLPGLLQTQLPFAGRISGKLRLEGGPGIPSISGRLALEEVTFQGRPVGGGALEITPGAQGAIRAHGRVIEGITADGVLSPGRAGLSGEASLALEKLKLDPFLAALPGGIRAAGILSGRVVARVQPGHPAVAEGRLSELTLVVTPPPRGKRAAAPIELRADGDIPLAAQTGEGPIAIGPARFRSSFGAFTLAGESRGDDLRGTVRGRVDLGPFAPLAAPWVERLAGAVDVDLAATRLGAARSLSVDGSVAIATPVVFRPVSLPVDARIPSGRIALAGLGAETTGLPVSVRADRLLGGALRRLEADLRIDARLGGLPAAPGGRARVGIDRLAVEVPALGPRPIVCEHGSVALEGRGENLQLTAVDLPARGEAHGIATGGTHIDDATFSVRLRGDPRRRLALSGDVQLVAVRTSTKALAAQSKPARGGAPAPATPWAGRPEIENTDLDLRLRSKGGAVAVDVPHVPDLRVDLDMHVGGTVKRPVITGEPKGANLYSSFMLSLGRLFR